MKHALVFLLAIAAAVPASAFAAPAGPQPASAAKPIIPHDNKTPINISSDTFQADLNGKTGTWSGNVILVQGDMKLRANSVRVTTVNGNADKVMANGNVVVDSPKSGTITGETGVYSVVPRIVVMNGNVVLKKGKDVMRGAQLTVNVNTGQAVLGGGAKTPGVSGVRVQGVFTPNSN